LQQLNHPLGQFPTTAYRDERNIERHGDCYASPHRIQETTHQQLVDLSPDSGAIAKLMVIDELSAVVNHHQADKIPKPQMTSHLARRAGLRATWSKTK